MKFRNQLFPLSALAAAVVASFSTTAEEQPIELDKFVVIGIRPGNIIGIFYFRLFFDQACSNCRAKDAA